MEPKILSVPFQIFLSNIQSMIDLHMYMKIKPIKQRDSNACGPTSIEMVTRYFNLPYSVKQISDVSKYKQREGLSNLELVETLEKLGFQVRTKFNSLWDDLKTYNTKENVIILSWMFKGYIGHFSVLQKVHKEHIYIADPHDGKTVKMNKIVFMRLWFDYDEMWYPEKNTDIQLRWMAIVSKK